MSEEQLDEVLLDESKPQNERMGFGIRLGAYMLDVLIIMIAGSIVGFLFGDVLAPMFFGKQLAEFDQVSGQLGGGFGDIFGKTFEITSGISIVGLSLFVMEGAFGQSFGKMMLKIINTNVDGSPADPGKLWLRSSMKYGSSILSLLGGFTGLWFLNTIASILSLVIFVGFFLVFMDNKQTIHDMIAKTVVSKKQ